LPQDLPAPRFEVSTALLLERFGLPPSDAVILDEIVDPFPFAFDFHENSTAIYGADSVDDGVFDERLEHERGHRRLSGEDGGVYVNVKSKPGVALPVFEFDVVPEQGNFFLQGYEQFAEFGA